MTLSGVAAVEGWFDRHPLEVAWDLVGAEIAVVDEGSRVAGRIVEVEAYSGPNDLAAHSGRLKAARDVLFGRQARLYMYRSYGIHTMLNIVAHGVDQAGAVLVRACEPTDGESIIAGRRATARGSWLRGPGALCEGLGFRLSDNCLNLVTSARVHLNVGSPRDSLMVSPRIGISKSMTAPWRIFVPDSAFVSRSRRGTVIDRASIEALHYGELEFIP